MKRDNCKIEKKPGGFFCAKYTANNRFRGFTGYGDTEDDAFKSLKKSINFAKGVIMKRANNKPLSADVYSLCETVADIAYIAGENKYYGVNSRVDIDDFISWAREFEAVHEGEEWGIEEDYIDAISIFTMGKLKATRTEEYKKLNS